MCVELQSKIAHGRTENPTLLVCVFNHLRLLHVCGYDLAHRVASVLSDKQKLHHVSQRFAQVYFSKVFVLLSQKCGYEDKGELCIENVPVFLILKLSSGRFRTDS